MKTSEIEEEIDSGIIEDIEATYKDFTEKIDLSEKKEIIKETRNHLKKIKNNKSGSHINQLVDKSNDLIEKLEGEATLTDLEQKSILAAFKYLIDPWDVIPDLISDKGLLDDFYVLELAEDNLGNQNWSHRDQTEDISQEEILERYGEQGSELLEEARGQVALMPQEKKAIQIISSDLRNNRNVSEKKKAFYASIVEKIIF